VAATVVDLNARRESLLDTFWPGLPDNLQMLMYHLSLYLLVTDSDYLVATLAAAVAKERADFDPLWLMLVSPSSSGKGEALRLLNDVRDAAIDDVTVPGMLGKGDKGMLVPLRGKDALAVISDFSTLLGDPKLSGASKSEVFNALRTIYDGSFVRDIHPEPVAWSGRLSLIAACTPAIDTYSAHTDALGTRWLYFRMKDRDAKTKAAVAKLVMQRADLQERRQTACKAATKIILEARTRAHDVDLPESLDDDVVKIATLVSYGRASIPRDWKREVEGIVTTEDPGRLVGQLRLLAIGLAALEVEDEVVTRIVRRAALSSMPQARARVLDTLAHADEALTEYRIAKSADLDLKVAQRALEDWSLVHFLESETVTGEKGGEATAWALTDDGKELASAGLD
jgi:hypothetical protein